MTLDEANVELRAIRKDAEDGDDEAAHAREDALRELVLKAISDGTADNPRELATIALRSNHIRFSRWCV